MSPVWLNKFDPNLLEAHELATPFGMLEVRRKAAQGPAVQTILCLHGFLAHARWWDAFACLLPSNWDLVSFSWAGMGQSQWRAAYSREQDREDVLRVLDWANFERKPLLLAHSFGGGIGTHVMAKASHRFQQFVMLDTSMRMQPMPLGISWRRPRKYYPDRQTAESRFRLIPDQKVGSPELVAYIGQHSIRHFEGLGWSWSFDLDRMSTPEANRDFYNGLIGIYEQLSPRPTFIRGTNSALCNDHWKAQYQTRLGAEAPLIDVANAHHHVLLDQPERLAALIEDLALHH